MKKRLQHTVQEAVGQVYLFRILCVAAFVLPLSLFANITPQFSYEKSASCIAADGGIIVKFKDESSSTATITERIWNRGDGSPNITGNNPTPSWSYSQPGVYRVNLTVKNQFNEVEAITQVVVVYPFPEVKFVADQKEGCTPLLVRFSDQTVASSLKDPADGKTYADPINNWSWDFGDGIFKEGALAGVEHTYTLPGNKRVRLSITTKEGCTIIGESPSDFIKVKENVQVDFFIPPPAICQFPVSVQANNRSTENATYAWSVTGPAAATLSDITAASPVFTFLQAGTYKVNLIVTGANGCSSQLTNEYVVAPTTLKNAFAGPDSACDQLAVRFTNQTTPDPGQHKWYVDGAKLAETKDFTHVFSGPGNYLVRLESFFGNCQVFTEKNIRIDPLPVADFDADKTSACDFPFRVNFSDRTGGNILRRVWTFGDGISRTETAPLGAQTAYTYNRAGTFSVGMTVFSDKGCSSTKISTGLIAIAPPVVLKTNLPDSGCAPFNFRPEVRFNIDALIQSWDWQVKSADGALVSSSTLQTPVPIELGVGKYLVTLRILTSSGCDKSFVWDLKVGEKPTAFDFSVSPAEACASSTFQFTYSGAPVTGYKWNFGSSDSVFAVDPARRFRRLGRFDVQLTVYNNGCENAMLKQDLVNVKGVVAWVDPLKDCANPLDKTYLDKSIGNIQQWEWNFGDGEATAYAIRRPQVVHTFQQPGTYLVSLKVSGDGCTYVDSVSTKATNEKTLDLVAAKLPVCIADTFLTLKALVNNPNLIKSYDWNLGCGFTGPVSAAEQKLAISALCKFPDNQRRGSYAMQLRVVDTNNCVYTSPIKQIVVGGPVASVAALSPVSGCSNLPVQFQDKSSPDRTNAVVSRLWDFGDGTPPVNIPAGPVSHLFANAGDFKVSLKVTDASGCTSVSNVVSVKTVEPGIDFNALQTSSCLGRQVQFEALGTSLLSSYSWDLGDGQTSALSSPVAVYSAVGLKNITLTVRDVFGCESTKVKTQYVEIAMPVSKFSAGRDVGFCPPFDASFSFEGAYAERFEWNFGDGGTSAARTPRHFYTKPGTYQVTLKAISPGGCESVSDAYTISVLGPDGTASYNNFSCKPFNTAFTMNSTTAQFVVIDYGDGNVSTTMPFQQTFSYRYRDTGQYEPKIFFSNGTGCTVKIPTNNGIRMIDMQPVFRSDENFFCGSGLVSFTDLSLSNDNLSGWEWDFGDGEKGSGRNPTHFYNKPGRYDVQLLIRSDLGCTDTLTKKQLVEVSANPDMEIMASKSLICEDDVVQFDAVPVAGTNPNVMEWFWDFTNGQSSTKPKPDPQQFRKVGTYPMRLYVKDDKGCTDTVFYDFDVNPLPIVDAGTDLQLCLGTPVRLNGTSNAVAAWVPAPSMSCTNCASPFVNPTTDTQYFLRATTAKGCTALDSVRVNVVQRSRVIAALDTASICVGDGVKLRASGTALYAWSPAVGLSASNVPDPLAKPAASTAYVVEGRDPFNCFITYDTVFVRVNALPAVDAGRDTTLKAGYPLQLQPTYSQDVVKVKWEPGIFLSCDDCKTPVVTPSYAATYTIFAYNQAGCVAKDVINVLATCTKENLFIPNTFSPNGDGMNDVFYPRGRGIEKIRAFRVFNRWGQLIHLRENFFANDQNAGWKGRYYSGDAPPDVYVYMLDVVCENGNIITLKGDVTLLR